MIKTGIQSMRKKGRKETERKENNDSKAKTMCSIKDKKITLRISGNTQ
jgi:hypothetical protein